MTTIDLTPRVRAAADYITAHGWTQGSEKDADGSVCLTGAVRYCAPQDGDEHIIRAVLRRRGHAEEWNDDGDRTAAEVVAYLRSVEITDADLADTFGPQWEAIVALMRRAGSLTTDEASRLDPAWDAARAAARAAAWATAWDARAAAWDAARDAARAAARDAAWDAAWAAAWAAAWDAARAAARDAASALVVRDLIGSHGFTQAHYDTLTGPWATTIGRVHPDDPDRVLTPRGER